VLRKDKEILWFPFIAGVIVISVLAALLVSLFISPALFVLLLIATMLLGSIAFAFLGVFFEAAVIGCATIRLQGGNPTVRDGLKIAARNWWPLLQWAFIGMIVGIILGFIRGMFRGRTPGPRAGPFKRLPAGFPSSTHIAQFGGNPSSGLSTNQTRVVAESELGIPGPGWGIGDILAGVLGMAWAVATFFVIPVMIYEKLSPLRAVKRSVEIIRDIWKETLILKFGFKAIFTLLGILGLLFVLLGVMAGVTFLSQPVEFELMSGKGTTNVIVTNAPALIAGFAVAIAYWIALACVSFALKGILKAALYECSRKGQVEPSVQPQQAAEFNPLNNIIRSFQSE
jgi:hypothetical protein